MTDTDTTPTPAEKPGPTRRRATLPVVMAVAAALVIAATGAIGVAAGGAGSLSAANPAATPTPSNPAASPSATPTPSAQSTVAAVEALVQTANDEQQRAFAQNDPTLMRDTATAAYYAQLVQLDAAMRSGGVTDIQMLSLTFDQAATQGNVAQVVTTETWQATFTDGSTSADTSVNNYSLVLVNGAWKIASDTQPNTNVPPGGSAGSPPTTVGSTSRNWSGYVATGGTFTAVTATWTVPSVTATGTKPAAEATWVGIGGATTTDLVQAGTQSTVQNGLVQYSAWIETLPQASQNVPLTISAGDTVTVSLTQQLPGTWNIAIRNTTTGGSYSGTVTYASSVSSAEWIEEAPSVGRGVVTLDQFGAVRFTNASTVKDGQTVTPAAAAARPVTMVNTKTGVQLATPSALGTDGASFSVTRG